MQSQKNRKSGDSCFWYSLVFKSNYGSNLRWILSLFNIKPWINFKGFFINTWFNNQSSKHIQESSFAFLVIDYYCLSIIKITSLLKAYLIFFFHKNFQGLSTLLLLLPIQNFIHFFIKMPNTFIQNLIVNFHMLFLSSDLSFPARNFSITSSLFEKFLSIKEYYTLFK